MPILHRGLKDKVANVRYVTVKIMEDLMKHIDSATKDKVRG